MKKLSIFNFQLSILTAFLLSIAPALAPITFLGAGAGCATVERGQDPVIVNAERLAATAWDLIDQFLQYEKNNRAALWARDHAFKRAADDLRARAPASITALRTATRAYKANRTAENEAGLNTWYSVVTSLIASATAELTKAKIP
jgi:hypothetical protein